MLGGGIMKKVLMYMFLGPLSFLLGKFNIMDFFLVPMMVPMFSGIFGGLGIGGAAGAPATAAT